MRIETSAPARKNVPARFLWVAVWMMTLGVRADAAPPAGEETRALWVVRHAITTPGRVDQVVDIASQLNINTLLVQVRGRDDPAVKVAD